MGQQLPENTAGAPHVDGRGLGLGVEEELGRPVPQRHHAWRHRLKWQAVEPGQTKVGDFQAALRDRRSFNCHISKTF